MKLEIEVGTCLRYQEGAGYVTWWHVVGLTDTHVTLEAGGDTSPPPATGPVGQRRQKTIKRSTVRSPSWQVVAMREPLQRIQSGELQHGAEVHEAYLRGWVRNAAGRPVLTEAGEAELRRLA